MRVIALLLPAVLWAAQLNGQVPEGPEPVDTVSDAESAADTIEAADEPAQDMPWRTSYFPYITGGSNDGPVLSSRAHYWQPAQYDARSPPRRRSTADVGITSRGKPLRQRSGSVRPTLEGLAHQARSRRRAAGALRLFRAGQRDREGRRRWSPRSSPSSTGSGAPATSGEVEVTRQTPGPAPAWRSGQRGRTRVHHPPGTFALRRRLRRRGAGDRRFAAESRWSTTPATTSTTPTQGLLLEAGAGGERGRRLHPALQRLARLPPGSREGTVVAARIVASGMGGTPTLNARSTLPAWENGRYSVLGGQYSHRSLRHRALRRQGLLLRQLRGPTTTCCRSATSARSRCSPFSTPGGCSRRRSLQAHDRRT